QAMASGTRAWESRASLGRMMPGVKREPKSPVPRSRQGILLIAGGILALFGAKLKIFILIGCLLILAAPILTMILLIEDGLEFGAFFFESLSGGGFSSIGAGFVLDIIGPLVIFGGMKSK
ncbi:MAG: hypothetical protein ACTSU9_04120, partial [Promethearchaeota archaeon]